MATTPKTARKTPPKSTAKPRGPAKPRAARKPVSRAKALDTSTALSIGAAVLTAGAALAGFLARRQIAAWVQPAGSDAADLAPDTPRPAAEDRAPLEFRPNMDAPISAEDREALRPATAPAPSLVSAAGTMNSQTGGSE